MTRENSLVSFLFSIRTANFNATRCTVNNPLLLLFLLYYYLYIRCQRAARFSPISHVFVVMPLEFSSTKIRFRWNIGDSRFFYLDKRFFVFFSFYLIPPLHGIRFLNEFTAGHTVQPANRMRTADTSESLDKCLGYSISGCYRDCSRSPPRGPKNVIRLSRTDSHTRRRYRDESPKISGKILPQLHF